MVGLIVKLVELIVQLVGLVGLIMQLIGLVGLIVQLVAATGRAGRADSATGRAASILRLGVGTSETKFNRCSRVCEPGPNLYRALE